MLEKAPEKGSKALDLHSSSVVEFNRKRSSSSYAIYGEVEFCLDAPGHGYGTRLVDYIMWGACCD